MSVDDEMDVFIKQQKLVGEEMTQRYDINWVGGYLQYDEEGAYVKYTDHQAALAEKDARIRELELESNGRLLAIENNQKNLEAFRKQVIEQDIRIRELEETLEANEYLRRGLLRYMKLRSML